MTPRRILIVMGGVVLLLSWANIFPALILARLASADSAISQILADMLQRSQWLLAVLLVAAGFLAPALSSVITKTKTVLTEMPGRGFYGLLALTSFLAAFAVQSLLFENIPHVTDAVSHYFQAKILAMDRLWVSNPPCHEHFAAYNVFMSFDGKWHTKYFPGQALWLALGMKLGVPWFPMPFAWAILVVSFVYASERFFTRLESRLAGLLLVFSPLGELLAGSFMSHTTFLMFASAGAAMAVFAYASHQRPGAASFAWAGCGILMGLAAVTRPQDVPPIGLLGPCIFLLAPREARSRLLRALIPFGAGALLPLAYLLYWNHAQYGSFIASGYNFRTWSSLSPVMTDTIGFTATYSVSRALHHLFWTLLRFNKVMLGWPSSLLFALLAFFSIRQDRRDVVCLLVTVAVIGVYFFFPYYGFEYEARYYAVAMPFIALLTVRGIRKVYHVARRILDRNERHKGAALTFTALLVASCCIHALVYYWPQYIYPTYHGEYERVSPRIHQLAEREGLEHAVVLVPSVTPYDGLYSAGFIYNDPLLAGRVVYVRDLGRGNDCLFEHFQDRVFYRYVDGTPGALIKISRAPSADPRNGI